MFARNATTGSLSLVEELVQNEQDAFGTLLPFSLRKLDSLSLSRNGRFLYASGSDDAVIHRFLRNASGGLMYVGTTPVPVSFIGIGGMAMSADGETLFTNTRHSTAHIFSINQETGDLSLVETFNYADVGGNETFIQASHDLRRVYISEDREDNFRVFEFEQIWNPIVTSSTSALLLSGASSIRFVPNPGYQGTASLTFRAWDGVDGYVYSTADTMANVAHSFSVSEETATVEVRGAAPVLDPSGSPTLISIAVDPVDNRGTQVRDLVRGAVTDADGNDTNSIALTAVDNTNGQWQFLRTDPARLSPVAPLSLESGDTMASGIVENQSGTRVYRAAGDTMKLYVHDRDPISGTLSLLHTYTAADFGLSYFRPSVVRMIQDDKFLVVSSWSATAGEASVHSFRLEADGSLTHATTLIDGVDSASFRGIADIQPSQDGRQIYVAAGAAQSLTILAVDSDTGSLSILDAIHQGELTSRMGAPGSIALSGDGRSVYLANSSGGDATLVQFDRNVATGLLSHGMDYYEGINDPFGNALPNLGEVGALLASPDGRFLYVFETTADSLHVFRRHPDGSLEFRSCSNALSHPNLSLMAHLDINTLAISADGHYLVGADTVSGGELLVFGRDHWTGDLYPLVRQAFPSPPTVLGQLHWSTDLRRIYVSENGLSDYHIYETNQEWVDIGAAGAPVDLEAAGRSLLLSGSQTLRFVPNSGFSGTAAISYKAWDMSTGEAMTFSETMSGLNASVSLTEETATVSVGP